MSQAAFERGDWAAVIKAHPLESHDPEEWLRYGVALLQTLTPGPDVGKQQQQAALAFVQAQKEGAHSEQVSTAQQQAVLLSLREALQIAGVEAVAEQNTQPARSAPAASAFSSDDSIKRLLMIVAGLFDLKLPANSECLAQAVAVKEQLKEQKITTEMVEQALHAAFANQPNFQAVSAHPLLELLR